MIKTIISNNCAGGAIMHELGMEFKTPTILLQILPEDFPRFCKNLRWYMETELVECHNFTPYEEGKLIKMFGGIPQMPIGLIGDVLVCFQHYSSFEEAAGKWNERKTRIDYNHIGFIMHARGPEYQHEAEEFIETVSRTKLCITENFEIPGSVPLYPGEGKSAFAADNDGKLIITKACDYKTWREQG